MPLRRGSPKVLVDGNLPGAYEADVRYYPATFQTRVSLRPLCHRLMDERARRMLGAPLISPEAGTNLGHVVKAKEVGHNSFYWMNS